MKKSAFAAIFAIAVMVLSSLITPCRAQEMSMDRLEELQKNNVLPRAEQMPEFPGGMPALMEYLKEKIHYPKECRDAGIEGKAYIVFRVADAEKFTTLLANRGISLCTSEELGIR